MRQTLHLVQRDGPVAAFTTLEKPWQSASFPLTRAISLLTPSAQQVGDKHDILARFAKSADTVYNVPQMNKPEYTSTELATLAKNNSRPVTARYIARLCQQGRIPARKVGVGVRAVWLISAEDARRWLDRWLAKSGPTASATKTDECTY